MRDAPVVFGGLVAGDEDPLTRDARPSGAPRIIDFESVTRRPIAKIPSGFAGLDWDYFNAMDVLLPETRGLHRRLGFGPLHRLQQLGASGEHRATRRLRPARYLCIGRPPRRRGGDASRRGPPRLPAGGAGRRRALRPGPGLARRRLPRRRPRIAGDAALLAAGARRSRGLDAQRLGRLRRHGGGHGGERSGAGHEPLHERPSPGQLEGRPQ